MKVRTEQQWICLIINISGTGVAMPWKNQAWYLGSETGNVWASILMGDVSPSGKLPYILCGS